MTCKECLHYEACHRMGKEIPSESCSTFKDRSKFIEIPCKIGDPAWIIRRTKYSRIIKKGEVSEMHFTPDMELQAVVHSLGRGRIGKTVFLSREEAEKALEAAPETPRRYE